MKKCLGTTLFSFVFFSHAIVDKVEDQGWTRVYKQTFTPHEMRKNSHKESVIFSQINLSVFNQLLFSWNAMRPQKGLFTFYAQVRDAKTKRWYNYHKMIQWGKGLQKSFFNRTKGSLFCYARLEVQTPHKADGFRIKVVAQEQGDLKLIESLIASVTNFDQFKPERYSERGKGLKTYILTGVPKASQFLVNHPRADHLCSPTSLSMIIGSLRGKRVDPLICAYQVYDEGLDVFGNWGFNVAHAYEHCGHKIQFYVTRLSSFTALYELLHQKIPVAVSVRGPLKNAPKPYEQGHLLVVIGWDAKKKKVICHDPAFDEHGRVYMEYDVHDFVIAWERSRRLTYKPHLIS